VAGLGCSAALRGGRRPWGRGHAGNPRSSRRALSDRDREVCPLVDGRRTHPPRQQFPVAKRTARSRGDPIVRGARGHIDPERRRFRMTNNTLRRVACLVTLLALTMTPNIGARAVATNPMSVAPVAAGASTATHAAPKIGRGWGAMLGCAGCLVAGGLVVAGGPASILIAV